MAYTVPEVPEQMTVRAIPSIIYLQQEQVLVRRSTVSISMRTKEPKIRLHGTLSMGCRQPGSAVIVHIQNTMASLKKIGVSL